MKLDVLMRELVPVTVSGSAEAEVLGIVCDSRQVRPGFLFVAIPGVSQNGITYIEDAVSRGAVAVVSESESRAGHGVCHVRVSDARFAVASLAAAFHGRPADPLLMIGVTGTNGKTTTTYLLRDILRAAGLTPGLVGTVEYEIGQRTIPASRTTPDAPSLQGMLAQMVAAGCRSAVMEVSSHALSQKRSSAIDYDVGVFTNLTRDHLDYHKTMEDYFEAKALLFRGLGHGRKKAWAAINIDDPWGKKLLASPGLKASLVTYGFDRDASVCAENLSLTSEGSRFHVRTPWGSCDIAMGLLGRYNVSNALAAIAAAGSAGIGFAQLAGVFHSFSQVPGRLEEVCTGRGFQVFVDYAHTDDALENVLKALREVTRKRLIIVFGCGGNRDRTKRPAMGRIAVSLADVAIVTSDNPRTENPGQIISEIRAGFGDAVNFEVHEDRAAAIGRAIELAREGDIVLIAGKGHENFQEFDNRSIPFDDRLVAKRFL